MAEIRLLAIIMALACMTASCQGRLALIGLDKNGRSTHAVVDEEKYAEKLTEALVAVHESVVPALAQQPQEETQWKLRSATVGFGVKAEAGFGPFKLGIKPRIRATFANIPKPPIP